MRGLITALRTLTILPVPGQEAASHAAGLPFFALVGALVSAALCGAAGLLGTLARWPAGEALVVVAGAAVLTRALHLDGLMDWADGFGGGRSREHALQIMKDPHPGAFGVVAVVVVLLAKWVALERLAVLNLLFWFICAMTISRTAMVWLLVRLPYARPEGGTAGPFSRDARAWQLWVCLLTAALMLVAVAGPLGLAAAVAGLLLTALFGGWCRRRVGGVTGDLLGACGELLETVLVVAAAALGQRLLVWQEQAWRLLGL